MKGASYMHAQMRSSAAIFQLRRHSLSQKHLRSFCFFSDAQPQPVDPSAKNFVHGDLDHSKSVSIASVLEMIVNRARVDDSPFPTNWASTESTNPSLWKLVFEKKLAFEPKLDASFGEWLKYADMKEPTTEAKDSPLVIKKVILTLDANHDAQLDWVNIKLSFANVIHVLTNVKTPTAAFVFYKWVRERSYYVPDKSVFTALIDRLVASTDGATWDQVHFVMRDMIERKIAADTKQFGRLFTLVEAAKPTETSRMQLYVEWLLKMRPLGLELWFSTYEKAMKMCNKFEMYGSTISIFKSIPENSHCWAFTLTFSACKCTGNVDLAEELLKEMKGKNMNLNAECRNDLLTIHAIHGDADRARNLSKELKSLRDSVHVEKEYLEIKLSAAVVKNIVTILDANQNAQLDWIYMELSNEDVVHVLTKLRYPTSAFVFYTWFRERSSYVPEKAVYTALIDRLVASTDAARWDQVRFVMSDMLERKIAADSAQFGGLFTLVGTTKPINISRMQLYVKWLLEMKPLGLKPWFSTYEKVMRICNKLELYDSTISIFKSIPANSYSWAFTLASSACKKTNNVDLAEELLREMKMQNMQLDAKCCNDLLSIYASHGHADKAKILFEKIKKSGIVLDLRLLTSVINVYGRAGRVKEAEEVFRSIKQKLDPGIYRAMAACYRNAGHFNELLALLRQGDGSRIGATCFASAFEACTEKSEWKIAVDIMKDMLKWGMSPSKKFYLQILLACSKVNDYSACESLDFNLREMDALSQEDLERVIKMYVSLEKIPCVLDALEVLNERGFGPLNADLYEYCIITFSKTSLTDAMKMYNIMQSAGYVPSPSVFSTLLEKNIVAEEKPLTREAK
ncbi:hypothetical protein GOP47_0030379 [Adiantum capillus-veneris]|nr:hypothetical protein GOP47_0030379 [Adiantum capillus-veneris]